jgi:hypothetical protein
MIHAFLVTIGVIAAIALAPVVFAVLRNPFFWIVSIITGFTGIAIFVVWALATAPHEKSFAEQRYESQIEETKAVIARATPTPAPTSESLANHPGLWRDGPVQYDSSVQQY